MGNVHYAQSRELIPLRPGAGPPQPEALENWLGRLHSHCGGNCKASAARPSLTYCRISRTERQKLRMAVCRICATVQKEILRRDRAVINIFRK